MSITDKSTRSENNEFSILKIIFTIFSIILLRLFLENFVYPDTLGYFFSLERFLHAIIYFYSIFLSLTLLIYLFTKVSINIILPFMTKIFLFILVVPVIDFIFNKLYTKATMAYLIVSPNKFLSAFFDMINPFSGQGVTIGQHFAAYGILISIAFFTYRKNRSVIEIFFLFFLGYGVLFLYEMIPSIVVLFGNNQSSINQTTLSAYYTILNQSWLFYHKEGLDFLSNNLFKTETIHEIAMAKIFFISLTLQLGLVFFIANKKIWGVLKKELRIERIIYWFIIAIIGIIITTKISGSINLQNPINIVSLSTFLILLTLNIWFAALINDMEDINIDNISNPSRPLIAKTISIHDWKLIQTILLILIILGSATTNKATVSLLILAQAVYYLYSAKPLRLKRHFIASSILIGISSIAIAMAGFFLVSPNQHVNAFPVEAIIIIGISYALLSNLKDIKDYAGDKQENMQTMPVVFGLENSKRIIALLYAIVFISLPFLINMPSLIYFSILCTLFTTYLFIKKQYQEKYIFLVLFFYATMLFLAII